MLQFCLTFLRGHSRGVSNGPYNHSFSFRNIFTWSNYVKFLYLPGIVRDDEQMLFCCSGSQASFFRKSFKIELACTKIGIAQFIAKNGNVTLTVVRLACYCCCVLLLLQRQFVLHVSHYIDTNSLNLNDNYKDGHHVVYCLKQKRN